MRPRTLVELSPDDCQHLLRTLEIGRVVFCDTGGPVALPVNYVVDHDDIVFRTAAHSSIIAASYARGVSFEVDSIDAARHKGWSVLATGQVTRIQDPAELCHVEMLGVTPWAEGPRSCYLRLEVRRISGRRIVAEGDPEG